MALTWKYISDTVSIAWTKRYVRYRQCGLRSMLRRMRNKHRVHKRKHNFLIKEMNLNSRKPIIVNKPQRRNFNSFYRRMEIPV